MNMETYYFTSESVTEGHPDKVADAISDSILDAIMAQDKKCRVACETLVTTGLAFIAGEITIGTYLAYAGGFATGNGGAEVWPQSLHHDGAALAREADKIVVAVCLTSQCQLARDAAGEGLMTAFIIIDAQCIVAGAGENFGPVFEQPAGPVSAAGFFIRGGDKDNVPVRFAA